MACCMTGIADSFKHPLGSTCINGSERSKLAAAVSDTTRLSPADSASGTTKGAASPSLNKIRHL